MRTHEKTEKGSIGYLVVIACVICAGTALGLAVMAYMDVSLFGFPDGYVTDYQEAASTPLRAVMWLEVGLGLVLVALAFAPISTKARLLGLLATAMLLVLVTMAGHVGIPWYFGTHLGLDNGVGG